MKKIFLGISMMLLSALSFTAAAQTQNQEGEKQCPKKEQCDKAKKDCKKDKKCDAKCADVQCSEQNCAKAECANAAECAKAAKKCCKGDSVNGRRFDKKCRPDGFRGKHSGHMDEARKGNPRARLFHGIELSEEQKAQIDALDKKMAEERKALKDEEKVNRTEAKAEMKKAKESIRETYETALKEILTQEQYAKYETNREAMKVRMGARKDMGKLKGDVARAKKAERAGVKDARKAVEKAGEKVAEAAK